MRGSVEIVVAIAGALCALLVVGALVAWLWLNAADKRDCRRHGGTVVEAGNAEWHCVGATPEVK